MKSINFKKRNLSFWVYGVLILITIIISFQSFSAGTWEKSDGLHTNYNNYLIFKTSATHLIQGLDLYAYHPKDHYDLYKYSPFFAMLMTPFTLLPNWLGILLWNFLNLVTLIVGLRLLPGLSKNQVSFILLIALLELIGSMMNEQSNALMSGLMILGVALLEDDKPLWAAFFLVLSVYIKLFSIVIFMIVLFYPSRIKSILYSAIWMVIFALLPVIIIGWEGLVKTYISWLNLLEHDFDDSVGYSLLGILVKWFNYQGSRMLIFFSGVILMILPLLKITHYKVRNFRYAVFSALLIWVIIFNHKAESPTFVIAMTGVGLYFITQRFTLANKIWLLFCILLVSIAHSDITPVNWRNNFFHPYYMKAFPTTLLLGKIIYEIMFDRLNPSKALVTEEVSNQ